MPDFTRNARPCRSTRGILTVVAGRADRVLCVSAPGQVAAALQTFQASLRDKDFTLTAELPLAPAATKRTIVADLAVLGDTVDAVQVTDNPAGIPHMSPLVVAGICLEHGCDPLLHISGRDRNRIALQSDILGAAAAGVTSLLMMRGSKLPDSLTPRASKVYEFGAKRLLRCAYLVSGEEDLIPAPGFMLGSMVRVMKPRSGWQPRAIEAKADVGCKFIQTQPLLDTGKLQLYLQHLVAARILERVSVVVSIPLLTSMAQLEALMQAERRGLLTAGQIERLRQSSDTRREGIALCAETLHALRSIPGVSGANIVAIENCNDAIEAISLSEIRTS